MPGSDAAGTCNVPLGALLLQVYSMSEVSVGAASPPRLGRAVRDVLPAGSGDKVAAAIHPVTRCIMRRFRPPTVLV